MNNLRLFVVVALAAFLVACASTVAIPSQAYAPPPKSALATVYVLRFNSMPLKANIQVGVDGKTLMLLPDNRYTWFQVPAGPRVLSAGYPSFPDMTAKLPLDLAEGQTYVLRYSTGDRGMSLIGQYDEPVPVGMTANGRYWTRLQSLSGGDISQWLGGLEYVATNP